MLHPFALLTVLSLLLFSLQSNGNESISAETIPRDMPRDYLIIGKVTTNARKHYNTLKPIGDYLASHMLDLGIREARVVTTKNMVQMIQLLKSGQIDLVTETAHGAVNFIDHANAEPLLLRWKKGVRDYHSLIFVRDDSDIQSLNGLADKRIAFEDSGSTTGYLLPKAALIQHQLKLSPLSSPRDSPLANTVGYVFSGAEQNTSAWVYSGLAEAGAVNNEDWNKPDHMPINQKNAFRVIYRSAPIPRAIELVRRDLDPHIRERIRSVLLNSHLDPGAKKALERYQKTTRFEPIDDATLVTLDNVRAQISLIGR